MKISREKSKNGRNRDTPSIYKKNKKPAIKKKL